MATKRKKSTTKARSKFRASWRGQLRFGLVSFEVQAVNAENKQKAEIHFHYLHEPDNQRINYVKVCPKHGEVPNDEIVEAYPLESSAEVRAVREAHQACCALRQSLGAIQPSEGAWP